MAAAPSRIPGAAVVIGVSRSLRDEARPGRRLLGGLARL